MHTIIVLALCLAVVAAVPSNPQRIVGGSVTTISQYPSIVALLYSPNQSNYWQTCGGTIINTRNVLSAAHCVVGDAPNRWRVRVGSTYANSGGVVHNVQFTNIHFSFNRQTLDGDIVVVRLASVINYVNNVAQAGLFAGFNYNVADNQPVSAAGWGSTSVGGALSEQLRDVQVYTINQETCRSRYAEISRTVTENMLCSGWLDVGGRDQCQGGEGSPLYHNGVVVGVHSWSAGCGLARYPGVNARVSRFTSWIQNVT